MNKKAMSALLSKKFNDWVSTITDVEVKDLVLKNTIITGGCITSLLLKEEIKDFDIYFTNKKTTKAVANYYVKQFNELNKNRVNKLGSKVEGFVLDGADVQAWKDGKKKLGDFAPGFENQGTAVSHMISSTSPDQVKIIFRSDGVASEKDDTLNEPFDDVFNVLDKDQVEEKDSGARYRPIFLSSNAITLANKIQLVIRFYGEAEEIHKNYDFVHCTNYWTSRDKEVVLNQRALESILNKELIYVGSKYPLCSIIRTRKFIQRGWHINAGQYLKMCFQLNEFDLTDIAVLNDQLTGVDSAYFMILIDTLTSKKASDPNFNIDSTYVAAIVDKIF